MSFYYHNRIMSLLKDEQRFLTNIFELNKNIIRKLKTNFEIKSNAIFYNLKIRDNINKQHRMIYDMLITFGYNLQWTLPESTHDYNISGFRHDVINSNISRFSRMYNNNIQLFNDICNIERLKKNATEKIKEENKEILNILTTKVKEKYIASNILSMKTELEQHYFEERVRNEIILEKEKLDRERLERERLERERQNRQRLERIQILEKERLERRQILEKQRQNRERLERRQRLKRKRQERERQERERQKRKKLKKNILKIMTLGIFGK